MGKSSFVLYDSYKTQLEFLSMDERGALLTAIFNYRTGEELPLLTSGANMLFSVIKERLDIDEKKYTERCDRGRENGKLGAEYGKLGGRPSLFNEILANSGFSPVVKDYLTRYKDKKRATLGTFKKSEMLNLAKYLQTLSSDMERLKHIDALMDKLKTPPTPR